MEVRFIVVDREEYNEDERVFETLEEANAWAKYIWGHLTEKEKKGREVHVVRVTEADIDEDYIDEDGEITWVVPSSYDIAEGGFDSNEEAL